MSSPPMTDVTESDELIDASRRYLARWSVWLRENPDIDPSLFEAAMSRGDLPPDTAVDLSDENGIMNWSEEFPAVHRIYWIIRSSLVEIDGGNRKHHHRVAVMCIHDSFSSKPERKRLGLPPTALKLADMLGVTDRTLRTYRDKYPDVFKTSRNTIRDTFININYGRVFEALAESAATRLGRDGTADRRLFMQLSGDLSDKSITYNVDLAQFMDQLDYSKLTDEQLDALTNGQNPIKVLLGDYLKNK